MPTNHYRCGYKDRVCLLLEHPNIDVNAGESLSKGAVDGHETIVHLLLQQRNIDVNLLLKATTTGVLLFISFKSMAYLIFLMISCMTHDFIFLFPALMMISLAWCFVMLLPCHSYLLKSS